MRVDLEKQLKDIIAKISQKSVAIKLSITESDLSRKLNGERGWKINEIQAIFEMARIRLVNDDGGDFRLIMELNRKLFEMMKMVEDLERELGRRNSGA